MKVIITGSTGMVGKSVLIECLRNDKISSVLVVNRRPVGLTHAKLTELLHQDFLDLSSIQGPLAGYDACFHCMGVSAVGMNEADYTRLTYDLTAHWADTMYELNPDMVFNYVSGAGTDSSEKGRSMWARVKGKTENKVLGKGFRDSYVFRPGGIIVEKGVTAAKGSVSKMYALFKPLLILMKNTRYVTTGSNIGKAMINSVSEARSAKHLENLDIDELAKLPE